MRDGSSKNSKVFLFILLFLKFGNQILLYGKISQFVFCFVLNALELFFLGKCELIVFVLFGYFSSPGQRKWSESCSTSRAKRKTFRQMMFMKVFIYLFIKISVNLLCSFFFFWLSLSSYYWFV